ncbi:MAG: TIGR03986 family CRISPR-associated RAMP protein, partial [Roseiflexaceae bacterium]|nr:TIGR03986 family CRISPR-associated RAMP protein [Roseiflexaceae bacterium]
MLQLKLNTVPDTRAALAPYNFVPLPDRVVEAELPLPDHDRYYSSEGEKPRYTGRIACTLTTASPLYVRCGLTLNQFQAGLDAKDLSDFFFLHERSMPVIPGSSLRGMLRSLVEIVGYGKMERVTDVPRFFYRAVAAQREDPLANPYRSQLRNVKAGVLKRRGDQWYVRPSQLINGEPFIKVRESDIPLTLDLVRLNDKDYHLQVLPISFTVKRLNPNPRSPQGRTVVDRIDSQGVHTQAGWLVTSGNMLETGTGLSPRKNHVVISESGRTEIPLSAAAVADYRNGLSDFQIDQLGPSGVLEDGRPVFYCEPLGSTKEITYFGHSPNFRVPYRFPGSLHAATPRDFVPEALRDEAVIDLAEAIFGFVRQQKQQDQATQARAGRVFVHDAILKSGQADIWYSEQPITPAILASPKPTTFQHYLVQPAANLSTLRHYADTPGQQTQARGHKLYWHKGADPQILLNEEQKVTSDTQKTQIRPVKAGVAFSFDIRFDNLSKVELGALLWVLEKAADPQYQLKLGMGKPLGLGSIQIESNVWVSNRQNRYTTLFDTDCWAMGEEPFAEKGACLGEFHRYVILRSGEPVQYQQIDETLRIRCLLALLRWEGPPPEQTRYLEIERDARKGTIRAAEIRGGKANEYKNRPVLPSPLQVVGEMIAPTAEQP